MNNQNKTVLVEMSGGVDSSMSFIILKELGYNVIGISFKYPVWESKKNLLRENSCCTLESFKIAEYICSRYGSDYYIIDQQEEFKKEIIEYFDNELKNGRTGNPCVKCNQKLKFGLAFKLLDKFNADYLATGHYVKNIFNTDTKEYELYTPKDKSKDQTYFLHILNQDKLSKTLFPLSEYRKEEIYNMAYSKSLKIYENIKESSDFCFVAGSSKDDYIKEKLGTKKGDIINLQGKKVGEHEGLYFYTLGQRKGIGFFNSKPYYVCGFDFQNNKLIICSEGEKDVLYKDEIIIDEVNIINPSIEEKIKNKEITEVLAKNRYQQKFEEASIEFLEDEKYKIKYKNKQLAPTLGQFCVLYQKTDNEEKICYGGGVIIKA